MTSKCSASTKICFCSSLQILISIIKSTNVHGTMCQSFADTDADRPSRTWRIWNLEKDSEMKQICPPTSKMTLITSYTAHFARKSEDCPVSYMTVHFRSVEQFNLNPLGRHFSIRWIDELRQTSQAFIWTHSVRIQSATFGVARGLNQLVQIRFESGYGFSLEFGPEFKAQSLPYQWFYNVK